MVTRKNIC